MRQKAKVMNVGNMVFASEQAKVRVKSILDLANKYNKDPEKEKRLEVMECVPCFYGSRIGGAAMTSRECMSCGKDYLYSSTDTDVLCLKCAKKHDLCKHCGGDIKMRTRRKDWPKPELMN